MSTRYDRPFDVVVLGDSFSANLKGQTDPGAFWTNVFAKRTGLSVVVVTRFDMTLADLLRHPVFLRTPPRLLFWKQSSTPAFPALRSLTVKPVPWVRDTTPEINFDQAANFLWKTVLRDILGLDTTRVVRLDLTRSDLFSSRTSDQLLVYDDELRKVQFTTAEALDQAYFNRHTEPRSGQWPHAVPVHGRPRQGNCLCRLSR